MQKITEIVPQEYLKISSSVQSYNNERIVRQNIPGKLEYYDCPECLNRGGRYELRESGEVVFVVCSCMTVRQNRKNIERSGLSDLVNKCTFDDFITAEPWQKSIKDTAIAFAEKNNNSWFYIGGQVGAGKTHICTAIVEKFLNSGKTARYMKWRDDSVKLKAVTLNFTEYEKNISVFKDTDVLYIDDFFKTERGKNPTTANINLAFEIINHRYNNPKLITIISCERSVEEIVGIDEAVGSRIFEKSKDYCLNIQSDIKKNYRLRRL